MAVALHPNLRSAFDHTVVYGASQLAPALNYRTLPALPSVLAPRPYSVPRTFSFLFGTDSSRRVSDVGLISQAALVRTVHSTAGILW